MSIRDIQAIFMIAFAMFIGMGLYGLVATFVVTRKKFIRWAFKKGVELAQEEEELVEESLK